MGIDEIIDNILGKAGDIQQVSLVGDYAEGVDSGKIDVLVLGENINQAYLLLLADKVGKKLGKQVNLSFQKTIEEQRYIILYTNHSTI